MSDQVKKKIQVSLIELAEHTDIEKINVSMLVKACGISRTLFYYYYQDIYDVLEDRLSTEFGRLISDCIKIEDSKESIHFFVQNYVKHLPFLRKISYTKYYRDAEKMIVQVIRKYLRLILTHRAGNISITPDNAEFLIDFMSVGITTYFFQHCEDSSLDVDKISEQLYQMIASYFESSF